MTKPKEKTISPETFEESIDTKLPPEPKRDRPAPKPRPGRIEFTEGEIASTFHTLIGGASKLLGYDYKYTENDFSQESKGIVRLSVKFPVLAKILVLVDPLLVLLGLVSKLAEIRKTKPAPVKTAPPVAAPQNPAGFQPHVVSFNGQ